MIEHEDAREIYSRLAALREFTPKDVAPSEHIEQFHKILNELDQLGGDFNRFRIPPAAIELAPKTLEATCKGLLLRNRIKDLINLFTLSNEGGKPRVALILPQ